MFCWIVVNKVAVSTLAWCSKRLQGRRLEGPLVGC